MKRLFRNTLPVFRQFPRLLTIVLTLFFAAPAFAQGASPWENAVNVLMTAFTSTIARGLSLVAIFVAGLTFAFEPSRQISAIRSTSSSMSSAVRAADIFPKFS
jgi:type IV secretory pathway VirB2 component (pilin)